jgi:carbon-monoxide dehydrogenase medium subunit
MGVADGPVRATAAEVALAGQLPEPDVLEAAGREATRDLEPASDLHGSSEFRRHLAAVAARRALTTAVARAGGAS